jgi:hypothetical protein
MSSPEKLAGLSCDVPYKVLASPGQETLHKSSVLVLLLLVTSDKSVLLSEPQFLYLKEENSELGNM